MDYYIVTKKVTLQAKDKEFHKDRIITAEDVGSKNIERFLSKGYIRLLGDEPAGEAGGRIPPLQAEGGGSGGEPPFYMTAEHYLAPEQVNKLLKAQLVEYAGRIGLAGFKAGTSSGELKKLINQFIEEAEKDDDGEDCDGESEEQERL